MFDSLTLALRRATSRSVEPKTPAALPMYSPIAPKHPDDISASPTASTSDLNLPEIDNGQVFPSDLLTPAQRHANPSSSPSSHSPTWLCRPSLSRFLADFTLGFADGLTVPFALTAGLSSLGQTDTVIYAGMAEICAGSISMGIGGYLSAKGEAKKARSSATVSAAETSEKTTDVAAVDNYLAPLQLPSDLLVLVRQHAILQPDIASTLLRKLNNETDEEDDDSDDYNDNMPPSSISVGLSIAAGYLIGGSLPLSPYFAVSHVGDGLMWSFIVCVVALFSFGFAKELVLRREQQREQREQREAAWVEEKEFGDEWQQGMVVRWRDIRKSAWEGLLMVMLGSMAALAAVLCVRLFDGLGRASSEP